MKFTLIRSTAINALRQALKTCNIKAKGQADSEFLFTPNDDHIIITSLNETAEQNLILPCLNLEYDEGDNFSTSGQGLVEFISQFPEEEIKCMYKADDASFVIGSKKTRFVFPTGSGSDFIPFNYQSKGKGIEVSGNALGTALRATSFAASRDHTQAPYTAVHVSISGDELVAQACDMLRISSHTSTIDDVGSDSIDLLIPYETAEILSVLLDGIDVVTINPGDRHVRFEWGETVFTSTLENAIGKPYPDITKFMKGTELGRVKISKANLLKSLKLAGLVAKDSYISMAIKELEEDGTGGGLIISTNELLGVSQDTLVVQEQSGSSSVNIAHKFITKAVESASNAWLHLSFRELKQGIVALVMIDGNFEHLIFPVTPNQPDEESEDEN